MRRMSSAALVKAYSDGEIELAKSTDHYSYSHVSVKSHPGCVLGLVRSTEGIDFPQMAEYFGQVDALEAWLDRFEAKRADDAPYMWLYYNDADQPPDPGGNPVRAPFFFQVATVLTRDNYPGFERSANAGEFAIAQLRALRVASVIYKGSFPHQDNSGFTEACMTLVTQAETMGYRPSRTLYRELYHHTDHADPTQSICEIQIEIER